MTYPTAFPGALRKGLFSSTCLAATTPLPNSAVAMSDAAEVVVGQSEVLNPLLDAIPGADPLDPSAKLTLAAPVGGLSGLTVSTDLANGQVTVTAQQSGIYPLSYQAAFGSAPLSKPAQILVDARPPDNALQEPVTTPAVALLRGQLPTTVDVLTGDYDPLGGLLTVVGATAPSGIEATPVDGGWLQLVATTPRLAGQQIVDYRVTNGRTPPVEGQVTVTWLPPLPPSPPVAPTIYATVRAGDEADVPVLSSDADPAGQPLFVVPGSVSTPDAGAASIDGGELRYAAPAVVNASEQVEVTYIVMDAASESTTGLVVLTVNPSDAAHDAAPVPGEVDARVTAGDTVIIPIPTSGVDPAGDSVSVSDITNPPELGRVLSLQANSITYQAYPLSAGTDSFSYEVETSSGLTGEATVRIAITPPEQPPAPIAVDKTVVAAPGATMLVNVLAGDIIAAGDNVSVEANARLIGNSDLLRVTAPLAQQPPAVVTYGITDGSSSSLAEVTVRSQTGYKTPPVAVDNYPAPPVAGHTSITVPVLANDYDPVGNSEDLSVTQVFGQGVVRTADNQLVIQVAANSPPASSPTR